VPEFPKLKLAAGKKNMTCIKRKTTTVIFELNFIESSWYIHFPVK
jgi:hypothetical protein